MMCFIVGFVIGFIVAAIGGLFALAYVLDGTRYK